MSAILDFQDPKLPERLDSNVRALLYFLGVEEDLVSVYRSSCVLFHPSLQTRQRLHHRVVLA